MRLRTRVSIAVGLVGCGVLAASARQDPPPAAAKSKSESPPRLTAKAFRLERATPADVRTALGQLLGPADRVPADGRGVAPPGAALWRVTDNERAKAVIVRGTDRHTKIAAEVVALIDRAAGSPLTNTELVRTVPLAHVTADVVNEAFNQLAYDQTRLWPASDKLVLLVGPDDEATEIAEWVKAIDVPAKEKDK